MIVRYTCLECNKEVECITTTRKIKCPICGTENDFWLEYELPPENHRE